MGAPASELDQAYEAFSRGKLEESNRLCTAILERKPGDARANHLAAAIALQRNDAAAALRHIDHTIGSEPGLALAFHTRGMALRALGRGEEAESALRHALSLQPGMAEAHASLGYCAMDRGDLDAAQSHLEESLRRQARAPEVINALGTLHARRGDDERAAAAFESALKIQPGMAQASNNLGVVRMRQHRNAEAAEHFGRALASSPGDAAAWGNLANAMRRMGRYVEAEQAYRRALSLAPSNALLWRNTGRFLREAGRFAEAQQCLERAVALAGSPEAHRSLAFVLLQSGDFARGWKEYRWRDGPPDETAEAALRAAIAAATPIELVGEQGLGDMLFFLRWATLLAPAPLRWRGDERIADLLGPTGLFAGEPAAGQPAASAAIRVGDLPALLESASCPPPLPMKPPPAALEAARAMLAQAGPPPYVAVAWRAGVPSKDQDDYSNKELPLADFARVLAPLSATVVSIQRAPRPGETESLAKALGRAVVDCSRDNDDLQRMAGLLGALDRYVGVSSTNAHIAASLGLGCSILVSRSWEWRYGNEGLTSPWFPTFKLYRESAAAGWSQALAGLGADLASDLL